MRACYVYWYHLEEHTDPFTQGYIGVTYDLRTRHLARINGYDKGCKTLIKAFKKYGDKIQRTVLHTTHKQCAYMLEEAYRPAKAIGWNIAIGGGLPPDTTGRKDSKEVCLKRAESVRKAKAGKYYPNPYKGVTGRYTPDQLEVIGKAHKGKSISEAHKQAIRDKLSGANSHNAKRINLVHIDDLTNVLTFDCVKEAADSLGIPYQALRGQAQRMTNKAETSCPNQLGWICVHENDLNDVSAAVKKRAVTRTSRCRKQRPATTGSANHKSKPICLENTQGIIQHFESINIAAKFIGLSEATLRYHVYNAKTNKQDSAYNSKGWRVKYIEGM